MFHKPRVYAQATRSIYNTRKNDTSAKKKKQEIEMIMNTDPEVTDVDPAARSRGGRTFLQRLLYACNQLRSKLENQEERTTQPSTTSGKGRFLQR